MQPVTVVADAPYAVYPGGIIALRAIDWINPASLSASVELDARAIEGEVVRETQQTTSLLNSLSARADAFEAANDTLTIDLSTIPVGSGFSNFYFLFVSLLIEGDFLPTDSSLWVISAPEFDYVADPFAFNTNIGAYQCMLGIQGDAWNSFPDEWLQIGFFPRKREHYTHISVWDYTFIQTGNEVLHLKAFARDQTNIEFLIDQIVLLPIGNWGIDYNAVGGGANTSNTINIPVDGEDGGDANGKFTWRPRRAWSEHSFNVEVGNEEGGGDYQKSASEYMIDIVPNDSYELMTDEGNPRASYCYSLHGVYIKEPDVHVNDTFSRVEGSRWDFTPEGWFWSTGTPRNVGYSVDGSRANMHFSGLVPRDDGIGSAYLSTSAFSANIEDPILSGKFEPSQATGGTPWDGLTTELSVIIALHYRAGNIGWGVLFDIINARWRVIALTNFTDPVSTYSLVYAYDAMSDWIDVSSWWSLGTEIGFRIEVKRFRLSARLWEASTSEPSTWDWSDFVKIFDNDPIIDSHWIDYPYDDDELQAAKWKVSTTAFDKDVGVAVLGGGTGYVTQWDIWWDDIVLETDPHGDPAPIHIRLESPKGTAIGEIEIPFGAWPFVFWGKEAFSEPSEFVGSSALGFAVKAWNDPSAAELQRAEVPFFYFRAITTVPQVIRYR